MCKGNMGAFTHTLSNQHVPSGASTLLPTSPLSEHYRTHQGMEPAEGTAPCDLEITAKSTSHHWTSVIGPEDNAKQRLGFCYSLHRAT